VAYDLEEQEKIASLKAWWDRYGNALTSIVLGVAVAVAGYNVYQWYQRNQAGKAAGAYDELQRAVIAKDATRMRDVTGVLLDKYGSTAYAEMGALLAAKTNLDAGDAKTAKAQFQWTIDHAVDPEYRALGRVRLAGVLLDEGSYDDAIKLVAATAVDDLSVAFQASFADRRGDIYVAQNKTDDAKREYGAALALLESRPEGRGYANVVQLKLDGLVGGGTPPSAPATAAAAAVAPELAPSTKTEGAKP
jgi:predicted negative regulator of RcsB-dependent stress response